MNLIKSETKLIIILVFILVSCKQKQTQKLIKNRNQDSITHVITNISNSTNEITSEETDLESSYDGYWRRTSYFQSSIKNEYLYHPRVKLTDKGKIFCFFGVLNSEDSKTNSARLYMLDEEKKLTIIDNLPIHNIHAYYFMSRQYSNLIIKNDILYYYKELPDDLPDGRWKVSHGIPKKEYYSYNLELKEEPVKINKPKFLDTPSRISFSTDTHVTFLEGTDNVALNNTYDIKIVNKDLWLKVKDSLPKSSIDDLMKQRADEVIISVGKFPSFDLEYNGVEPCIPAFGGLHWDSEAKNLYFDNSGPCYACIWKLDTESKKVTKIVPEHEAIHPFHYRQNEKTYVAYVYKGHLQIAESVPQTIDIALDVKKFDPTEYTLAYNHENSLEPVFLFNEKEDDYVTLPEGNYFIGSEITGIEFNFSVNDAQKITGSYRYESIKDYGFVEGDTYDAEYGIKRRRLQIEDSKIISEYLVFDDSYSFYNYNHVNKTAIEKTYNSNHILKSITNYSIEDDKYEGAYLKQIVSTHYNNQGKIDKVIDKANNKTSTYNDKGSLVKQVDHVNQVTYIYDDTQKAVEAIIDDKYVSFEPTDETMKWQILDKESFKKHLSLKPNMSYTLNNDENIRIKFKTNQNSLIDGDIIRTKNGKVVSLVTVSKSVLKTCKVYDNDQLIFDTYYNAQDSICYTKSYVKKDSIIETHVTTFVRKKNRFKKITKTFYASGRYEVVDDILDKTFLYDTNSNKISSYIKDNITYTEIFKNEKLFKRTYVNTEGDISEYYENGVLYRKEIAYFNQNGILFLKLYNGENILVKDVEMPVKDDKPVPSKVKL